MEPSERALTQSERHLLHALLNDEMIAVDWVELQHLRQRGLVEETPAGPKLTDKGRKAARETA